MRCFPEHIRSNEVSPVAVTQEIPRMTVDEYVRIVRDFGWESTELVEGVAYDVTPEYNRHADTVMDLSHKLHAALPDDVVRHAGSVHVSDMTIRPRRLRDRRIGHQGSGLGYPRVGGEGSRSK